MADTLFIVPFQIWAYGMIKTLAERLWLADRALLLAGLMVQAVTDWLTTELFGPAISDFVLLSRGLLPLVFTVAVFLLAIGYLLAPFFRIQVVNMGKAIGWLLFALLFYQAGPGLYVEGEAARRALSTELYAVVLAEANSAPTASGPVAVLNTIAAGPEAAMGSLDNQFGAFIPSDVYVDGLDLAMAYTLATGDDVVYALDTLPEDFRDEYFDPANGPLMYLTLTADERTESINAALSGVSRLGLALIIIWFGMVEQSIYLCLSLAAGVLFISMAFAVLLAFFERTEAIARTLVDMWIELFILSAVIAVLQALTVGMVTLGARTLNPTLTLGASLIGGVVMMVLLLKSLGAIWDALNRMFKAMSETVGGGMMSPAELAASAATVTGGAALTVATAGAGAAVAAGAGASFAQVAGSALSGMDALYGASALGSFILPEDSTLREPAQGFYEGALANRMLGPAGGLLLGAAGTSPLAPSSTPEAPTVEVTAPPTTAPTGETEVHFDAADLAGMREAVAAAISGAMRVMPPGGYSSPDTALDAVRAQLGALPLGAYGDFGHAQLDEYLITHQGEISAELVLDAPATSADRKAA